MLWWHVNVVLYTMRVNFHINPLHFTKNKLTRRGPVDGLKLLLLVKDNILLLFGFVSPTPATNQKA